MAILRFLNGKVLFLTKHLKKVPIHQMPTELERCNFFKFLENDRVVAIFVVHFSGMSNCTPYHVLYWDPSVHIITISIFAFLYTCVFFFGLAGNLAVIYITLKNRSLQTVQNLFIINLAVSDIILCLLSIPLTPITQIYKEWYFGTFLCRLVGGIQASASFIGSFSLCAIAIDRYFCLVVAPGRPLTRRIAFRITWSLWMASIFFTLPYVFHMKIIRYEKESNQFQI